MKTQTSDIVKIADRLCKKYDTRDPIELVDLLGITVLKRNFKTQKGAYTVILNNRFIFLKHDLESTMENIVLLHEIGHDTLHRQAAIEMGGFQEFNIFDMKENRMEYEANVFASQIALPDEEVLDYINMGYDIQKIAKIMHSDINLVALKNDTLISQGYRFRKQEHKNDFLK